MPPFLFAMATKKRATKKRAAAEPTNPATQSDKHADEEVSIKPKHFKKTAQDQIEKSYKKIVRTLAEEAKKGSVRHTKMLFDLGGVKEEVDAVKPRRRKSPSLGKLLLKEVETMKRSEAKKPEDDSKSNGI